VHLLTATPESKSKKNVRELQGKTKPEIRKESFQFEMFSFPLPFDFP